MATQKEATDLQRALKVCRGSFFSVGLYSMFINVLMLVPPLYMLQVYNRVISSRSEETLFMLTLVVVLYTSSDTVTFSWYSGTESKLCRLTTVMAPVVSSIENI